MEYIQDHYQAISNVADEIFYHDISNYAVPFFYACTGYFLVAGSADGSLNGRLSIRIKKVLRFIYNMVNYLCAINIIWLDDGG